jgi:hypothetical protein
MGRLIYADSQSDVYRLDDRLLAHLELAIGAKLRLGDAFAFTIDASHVPAGIGYHVLWIHPAISLQFRYDGERQSIPMNAAWIAELVAVASTEGGLRLLAEPDASGPRAKRDAPAGPRPIYG